MRDFVLYVVAEFGECLVVAGRLEYRVVAESRLSLLFFRYLAFHYAFHLSLGSYAARVFVFQDIGYHGAETRLAVFLSIEVGEQLLHVCLAVVSVASRISCRIYSGFSAESFNFESCVVGKHTDMIMFKHVFCLYHGIFFQSLSCLRNIHVAFNVVERQYLEFVSKNVSHFFQFVSVVCCKYYFMFIYS